MNEKFKKTGSIFINAINGGLTITILILLFMGIGKSLGVAINQWIVLLIYSIIYFIGIYVSRRFFIEEHDISIKNRLTTNLLLILVTAMCQYTVNNYLGHFFRIPYVYLLFINMIAVFVTGTIFHYSFKFISKYKAA